MLIGQDVAAADEFALPGFRRGGHDLAGVELAAVIGANDLGRPL